MVVWLVTGGSGWRPYDQPGGRDCELEDIGKYTLKGQKQQKRDTHIYTYNKDIYISVYI